MRHICLYTWGPDFHCTVRAGSPEVVQEALADLKRLTMWGQVGNVKKSWKKWGKQKRSYLWDKILHIEADPGGAVRVDRGMRLEKKMGKWGKGEKRLKVRETLKVRKSWKKVKKVRKREYREKWVPGLLCSGFYSVHFRKCAPLQDSMLHLHEEGTKQAKTQEGCGGCEGLQYNGASEVGGFPLVSRFWMIRAATCDNITIGPEKKSLNPIYVFANMQTDDSEL